MINNWRGCDNVRWVSHGSFGDPDLVIEYNGDTYVFNYWDIESALWDMFLDLNDVTEQDTYSGNSISTTWENKFNTYCQENAYEYMLDCIASDYFDESWDPYDEEYTWHYQYLSPEKKELKYELEQLLSDYAYDVYLAMNDKTISRKDKYYYIDGKVVGTLNDLDDRLVEEYYDQYIRD